MTERYDLRDWLSRAIKKMDEREPNCVQRRLGELFLRARDKMLDEQKRDPNSVCAEFEALILGVGLAIQEGVPEVRRYLRHLDACQITSGKGDHCTCGLNVIMSPVPDAPQTSVALSPEREKARKLRDFYFPGLKDKP